jgi:SAM-dependent methyltransferase
MPFNCYEDERRARAYARLDFPGTYHLAYRDLPGIFSEQIRGRRALDFGCGAGRSTRFLRGLGFDVIGVDVSPEMIKQARSIDPDGDYRLLPDGELNGFEPGTIDLILSMFTFDNIPTAEAKIGILRSLGSLLGEGGRIVNVVSSPEIYLHEWASFSTKDFPDNARARSGDRVRIIITDIDDARPIEDILWGDESYREVYRKVGLHVADVRRPLARGGEPYRWVNETKIAPWTVYVLEQR